MYSTSDLGLASALIATGRPLDGIELADDKRGRFNFPDHDDLEFAIDDYWQGRLLVEPKTYQTTMRELKTRVNEMIRSQYAR